MEADRPAIYRPRRPRASPLWQCVSRHLPELRAAGRVRRAVEENVLERFLECGRQAPGEPVGLLEHLAGSRPFLKLDLHRPGPEHFIAGEAHWDERADKQVELSYP